MPVANVVIVGAGLSGMVSALHLLDNGVTRPDSITVLEGRNRVGGRLQAHEGVDVGGAWCWNSAHSEVPDLAERFGVASFLQYDNGINVVDYGNSVKRTRQHFDSAKVRFDGGAAAIVNAISSYVIAKGVNVELDFTVNRISTAHDDVVYVEGVQAGELKRWESSAVFLAIPPRLVLSPLITWEPNLPAELVETARATPTWMADTTKVLVTYPRPFWRELGMSGNAISYGGGPIQQMYDSCGPDGGDGPHALCGFVFGSGAKDPPADDILRPQVLEQLKRIFGEEALSPLSFSSHRWGEQPLTSANGGATGEGRDSMGDSLLRRAFGSGPSGGPSRVWLSAAETDGSHAGLMEGAFLAGRLAAEEALQNGAFDNLTTADEGVCNQG